MGHYARDCLSLKSRQTEKKVVVSVNKFDKNSPTGGKGKTINNAEELDVCE